MQNYSAEKKMKWFQDKGHELKCRMKHKMEKKIASVCRDFGELKMEQESTKVSDHISQLEQKNHTN